MEKGLAKGLRKGKKEGLAEGMEKGLAKGERKKAIETAKKMLADGLPVESVAKYSDLSVKDIMSINFND